MNASNSSPPYFGPSAFVQNVKIATGFSVIFLCAVGLFGNLLSTTIFLLPHFRCLSINVLLCALSMTDSCLLMLAMPVCSVGPLDVIYDQWNILQPLHKLVAFYLYPLASMCRCCSVWLLVAVTIERWMAVCKPFLVNQYCTRDRAIVAAIVISIFSISYNMIRFWEFEDTGGRPDLALRKEKWYVVGYLVLSNLALFYIIPFCILIFFNGQVALQLARSSKQRRAMSQKPTVDQKTARMLLYVVLCFLCCYTPSLILDITEAVNPLLLREVWGHIFVHISNVLAIVTISITWLIYLKFSSRYRRAAWMMVIRCSRPTVYHQLIQASEQMRFFTAMTHRMSVSGPAQVPHRRRHTDWGVSIRMKEESKNGEGGRKPSMRTRLMAANDPRRQSDFV